jgi:putative ABC transport system ATP-binding protein
MGSTTLVVFQNLNLSIKKGDFLAIMGPSGSGKTTLLNILGCLQKPTTGSVLLGGEDLSAATDQELSTIRSSKIGFVFQNFYLIPHLTTYENVELPFLYSSQPDIEKKTRTLNALKQVGLLERLKHKPAELSGGELQRAAIARALVVHPDIILADEPTGNLDAESSSTILEMFKNLHDQNATILMVTHDKEVAGYAEEIVEFKDGYLRM